MLTAKSRRSWLARLTAVAATGVALALSAVAPAAAGTVLGSQTPVALAASARSITVSVDSGAGSVSLNGGAAHRQSVQVSATPGATITLVATPDPGWEFGGWLGGTTQVRPPLDKSVIAPSGAASATLTMPTHNLNVFAFFIRADRVLPPAPDPVLIPNPGPPIVNEIDVIVPGPVVTAPGPVFTEPSEPVPAPAAPPAAPTPGGAAGAAGPGSDAAPGTAPADTGDSIPAVTAPDTTPGAVPETEGAPELPITHGADAGEHAPVLAITDDDLAGEQAVTADHFLAVLISPLVNTPWSWATVVLLFAATCVAVVVLARKRRNATA